MFLDKLNEKVIIKIRNIINSKTAQITQVFIIVLILSLVMWDVYLYLNDEKENVSTVIRENAKGKLFVITWMWGILSSHLFVIKKETNGKIPEPVAILVLFLMTIIIFLLGRYIPDEMPQYMQIIFLFFGGITGYYLWPQSSHKIKEID